VPAFRHFDHSSWAGKVVVVGTTNGCLILQREDTTEPFRLGPLATLSRSSLLVTRAVLSTPGIASFTNIAPKPLVDTADGHAFSGQNLVDPRGQHFRTEQRIACSNLINSWDWERHEEAESSRLSTGSNFRQYDCSLVTDQFQAFAALYSFTIR